MELVHCLNIRMSNSSVSKSTSRDFCLFFSAEIRKCAFAVKFGLISFNLL